MSSCNGIIVNPVICKERWKMAIYDSLKRYQDPIWTQQEVEKFWDVLQPYLTHLLNDEVPLPDFNIDFSYMNANSDRDRQHCMEIVHSCMWKGRYSLAVANMNASKTFFDGENGGRQSCTLAEKLQQLEEAFKYSPLER